MLRSNTLSTSSPAVTGRGSSKLWDSWIPHQKPWGMTVLIGLFSLVMPRPAQAATLTAASCAQTDVQAAINSASSGDTVNLPAGTWYLPVYANEADGLVGPYMIHVSRF